MALALRPEFKVGLIASGIGLVVGGIFFASVKEISKTEAYGYRGVLLYSSLVATAFGLTATSAALCVGGQGATTTAPRRDREVDMALSVPQPIDALSRLGKTPEEVSHQLLNYDVAFGRARSDLLVKGLQELNHRRSAAEPVADSELPTPVIQEELPAIPSPARYEVPVVERAKDPTPTPVLYGMEEEDLWTTKDSMSGFNGPVEEDIFALD